MGRTCIVVDVQTVGLVVDNIGICAESIEHRLGDVPRATVSAVQSNLDALERVDAQRDQIAHITVTAGDVIHSTANMLTMSKWQFRPVLIEHMEFAVNVILHQQQSLLRHFFAVAVDQLNTVVIVWIVAGRDHDATVEIIHTSDVSYGRSRGDMEQISICTRSGQASDQAVLKHIGTAASILADNDTSRVSVTVALTQSVIIPTQKAPHLVGMVCC